jgi:hypothetical protein
MPRSAHFCSSSLTRDRNSGTKSFMLMANFYPPIRFKKSAPTAGGAPAMGNAKLQRRSYARAGRKYHLKKLQVAFI